MDEASDLEALSTADLLAGYSRTLAELRRRGIVRTNNAPAGDYAEWLVVKALGGTLAPNSEKSHDLTLPDGRRIQVKARVVSSPPTPGQLQTSPFRSWSFDLAALVLLDAVDYRPVLGVLVAVDLVREHAKARPHVNGEIVFIKPPLTTTPGVVDITDRLRVAAAEDGVNPTPIETAVVTGEDEECIHLLRPQECSLCRPRERPTRPSERHQWSELDDTVCVGAWYAYEGRVPPHVAASLAQLIGTTEASVKMRLANVDAVLGGGSLSNTASLTRAVASRFEALNPADRTRRYEDAVARLRGLR